MRVAVKAITQIARADTTARSRETAPLSQPNSNENTVRQRADFMVANTLRHTVTKPLRRRSYEAHKTRQPRWPHSGWGARHLQWMSSSQAFKKETSSVSGRGGCFDVGRNSCLPASCDAIPTSVRTYCVLELCIFVGTTAQCGVHLSSH